MKRGLFGDLTNESLDRPIVENLSGGNLDSYPIRWAVKVSRRVNRTVVRQTGRTKYACVCHESRVENRTCVHIKAVVTHIKESKDGQENSSSATH